MSERRQLALLLAGLVLLMAIGIGGAALFPEKCVQLEQLGELELVFTDAADALPLSDADGAALEAAGAELGIGGWRGAVRLPDDAVVTRSEFGFFVVTDTDFTVLRPSLGIASASRGRAGLDVFPAGTSLGLRADDGETGIFNGEYELDRCGELPTDARPVSVDRGFVAVVDDADTLRLVTLSGDEVWTVEGVLDAHVLDGDVVVVTPDGVRLLDERTGQQLDELTSEPTPIAWADPDGLLVVLDGAVVPVEVVDGAFVTGAPVGVHVTTDGLVGLVRTPAGVVGATDGLLTADRAGPVPLPSVAKVRELHASEDGHVGVLVEVDGVRALLIHGPDSAA